MSARTRGAAVVIVAVAAACSSGGESSSDGTASPDAATTQTVAATTAPSTPVASSAAPSSAPSTAEPATVATSAAPTTAAEAVPASTSAPEATGAPVTVTSGRECPTAPAPDLDQPVDVTFWHVQTGTGGEVIDRLAAEYDAAHPEVQITSLYQDPQVAFIPAVTSGELPDLISAVNANFMQLAIDSQVVLPVGACLAAGAVDVSDFLPRMLGATTKEGELWALPFFASELVLYYNPLAFGAAGLDPADPPATFEELHEMSKQIVASGYTSHGVAFTPNSAVLQTLFSLSSRSFADQDNGRSGRATRLTIGDEAGELAFTTLQEMVTDGTATTVADRFDALLAAGSKDAAMAIGGLSYDLTNILEATRVEAFPGVELGIAAMPGLTAAGEGAADVRGESLFLLDGPDPATVDAAYRFALWLTEPAQQARLHVEANSVPVRASTAEDPSVIAYWQSQPLARFAFDDLSAAGSPPGGGGAIIGQPLEVADLVMAAWTAASQPGVDAPAILSQLVADADAVIADYNARAGVGG